MLNIRLKERTNTWPGFVDLFSNLVIILIFLLIVFVFLWTTTSVFNKNSGVKTVASLKKANEEQAHAITQMSADEQEAKRLLILARNELDMLEQDKQVLKSEIGLLSGEVQEMDTSIEELVSAYESKVHESDEYSKNMQEVIIGLTTQLNQALVDKELTMALEQERRKLQSEMETEQQRRLANMDAERIALEESIKALNIQSESEFNSAESDMESKRKLLVKELEILQSALNASETKSQEQEIRYVEMSTRLNKALADKVAELNKLNQYQSDFYKAIKSALGDRTTIQQDGDRFIVSSDILFSSGAHNISPEGANQLRLIANVIKGLEEIIPTDTNWIIRIDGHTDRKAVVPGTKGYKNNTELSLLRATAVVKELSNAGVSKRRLVPSGFGELHPVELGSDSTSLQKNRRIELRLTNR